MHKLLHALYKCIPVDDSFTDYLINLCVVDNLILVNQRAGFNAK